MISNDVELSLVWFHDYSQYQTPSKQYKFKSITFSWGNYRPAQAVPYQLCVIDPTGSREGNKTFTPGVVVVCLWYVPSTLLVLLSCRHAIGAERLHQVPSHPWNRLVQVWNPKFLQSPMSTPLLRDRPWIFADVFDVPLARRLRMGFGRATLKTCAKFHGLSLKNGVGFWTFVR